MGDRRTRECGVEQYRRDSMGTGPIRSCQALAFRTGTLGLPHGRDKIKSGSNPDRDCVRSTSRCAPDIVTAPWNYPLASRFSTVLRLVLGGHSRAPSREYTALQRLQPGLSW